MRNLELKELNSSLKFRDGGGIPHYESQWKGYSEPKSGDPAMLFVSDEYVCGVGFVADKEIRQQPTTKLKNRMNK